MDWCQVTLKAQTWTHSQKHLCVVHINVTEMLFTCRSDAIYSAKYDGSGLIEVLRGHEYLSHPFAVTMYGGEVYWTDWRTNTLAKANKWTGSNVTVVQRTNTQPFDLQVYHPSRQPQGESTNTLKAVVLKVRHRKAYNRQSFKAWVNQSQTEEWTPFLLHFAPVTGTTSSFTSNMFLIRVKNLVIN